MSDLELFVRHELEALVPQPSGEPDWVDVLSRARPPLRRQPLVLALAAALLVVGTATGVTAALGGFDRWLHGNPGKPAPRAEQQRFEAANGQSWAAFPTGTKLRELVRTSVGGKTYVLYGFRSGNTVCLKLKAVTLGHSLQECAPVSVLTHASAPIVPVTTDSGFADRFNHPSAEVSFGIAADDVSAVDVKAVDGTHHAVVGGNAYLFVEDQPNTGNHVLRITALQNGRRTEVSVPVRFGMSGLNISAPRPARGPTHVERRIVRPTIGWYFARQPRGVSLEAAKLSPQQRRDIRNILGHGGHAGFFRLVKPDPTSDVVLGLTGNLCLVVISFGASSSCGSPQSFFSHGPINGGLTSEWGRFDSIDGVAADGVARIVVFLADGERQVAALKDNLFTAFVAEAQLPARVVAYDAAGRVVGIELVRNLFGRVPARALTQLRTTHYVRGPNGASGVLRIGPVVQHLRCWRMDFSTGEAPRGCLQTIPTGPWVSADVVQPAGRDLFLIGASRSPVVRIQLEFANGDVIRTRPVKGVFAFAIPRAHLSAKRQLAFVVGVKRDGNVKQRQGVLFRANP